ncbi:T7SS effector LXG polymorphic toxin [Peribacillus huizhouensis]|uniref:Ribonuclease toxin of YeeF-YezG toxin-antitoxin module n=1 Tax=Peribacillus huizhouensis TaxID=1501239 RepID=A0ABR6CLN4_9BACI|nr:T7SS effector LXG polymorphic toxin [Peribacillus huizhouensis]MBA9025611.1 putative ribonuclease toxin of YeeF-YezG toxin-antitoxin module [Peribacillus huizhouensis]
MKVLEVESLHSGIDEILDKIDIQKDQMNQIKEAVTNLIALEESLKGAGGNAIRGF